MGRREVKSGMWGVESGKLKVESGLGLWITLPIVFFRQGKVLLGNGLEGGGCLRNYMC